MENDGRFTEEKLARLEEPSGFAPNAARARKRIEEGPASRSRQWIFRAAIAVAVLILLLALPARRAMAQPGDGGTFYHVMHHVHWVVVYHWRAIQHFFGD